MNNHRTHVLSRQIGDLIEARTGIVIHAQMRITLDELLSTLPAGDAEAYLEKLRTSRETDPTWQVLIKALTIGETYFLRDQAHFDLLRNHILPELINRRREAGALHLNLWSVGCASGEEPYSLAITLRELLPDLERWTIRLVGTDLNAAALHVARRGVYRKWAFRHTSFDFQQRYFDQVPNGLQIKSEVRDMVTFRHMNLLAGPPLPRLDIIMSRNVLLYFNPATARRAESIFYDALSPLGWLFLGQAEALRHERDRWQMGTFPGVPVYQRPGLNGHQRSENGESGGHLDEAAPNVRINPGQREDDDSPATNAALARLYDDAAAALRAGALDDAERLARQLLERRPASASASMLLGAVCADRNRKDEARAYIDQALSIDPLLADAHYLRALVLLEDDQPTEAAIALHAALYSERNHPLAAFMLGNLHAGRGEIRRAMRLWENALNVAADLPAESALCDISDITAGQLAALTREQLQGWDV